MVSVVAEVWKSVRLTWRVEIWLPVTAVAYAVWVGASGLAIAIATGFSIPVEPWTSTTDALIGGLAVLWLAVPAAVATWLVRDRLTTDRGSIAVSYRLNHPLILLGPPAVILASSFVLVDTVGPTAWLWVLILYGTAWFVVRTAAYAYRVFALSLPPVVHAVTFVSAASLGFALIVAGGSALGLAEILGAVTSGLETRTGIAAIGMLADGTILVRGTPIPTAVALATGLSLGLAFSYVGVQFVAGVIARLVKPTVRRPELRAGQRYPAFARPTTDTVQTPRTTPVTSNPDRSTGETAEPAVSDDEPDQESTHEEEDDLSYDLRNTRVYRPSEDAASVDPEPAAIADGASQCPACGAELLEGGTCPSCGSSEA